MDEYMKFCILLGMLLGLTDFNNSEFRLKSGSVKRVFIYEEFHEVMLEFYDGRVCFARDTDFYTLDKIIRTYKEENPERFAEYKEEERKWIESLGTMN